MQYKDICVGICPYFHRDVCICVSMLGEHYLWSGTTDGNLVIEVAINGITTGRYY